MRGIQALEWIAGCEASLRRLGMGADEFQTILGNPEKDSAIDELFLRLTSERAEADGSQFPTWRTVNYGLRQSIDEYDTVLRKGPLRINERGLHLKIIPLATQPVESELVRVTGRQLGQERGESFSTLFERAEGHGLEPCPTEVALALREQYLDQPLGEMLLAAVDEVMTYYEKFIMLYCDKDGLWLQGSCPTYPSKYCDPDDAWIFRRKKKKIVT